MSAPKFPITVQLTGNDSNAFMMIANVSTALRKAGATGKQIDQFRAEAMSGDYSHVIATITEWVNVA